MTGRGVHATAREGFDRAARAYVRARPAYPAEAAAFAVGDATGIVADLGAGTGKLTRLLLGHGFARVIAVEPVAGMRRELTSSAPAARVVAAEAAALPLRTASVDALTAGQAIHWFASPLAVSEFVRVLRPDGLLAVVQNVRDSSQPIQRVVSEVRESYATGVPTFADGTWRVPIDETPELAPSGAATFPHGFVLSHADVLDHMRSLGPIAAAGDADLEAVERALGDEPDPVELRYTTEVYRWRRIR